MELQPQQDENENILNIDTSLTQSQFNQDFAKSLMRPLIYVDVNLAPGRAERITVFLGDTANELAS